MHLPLYASDGTSSQVELRPSKIVCVGKNYRAHAREMGGSPPAEPLLFFKPPSSLVRSGDAIVRPHGYERVDHEAELAMVIGTKGRHIAPADALTHVLGFTCANDVTVRDLQKRDGQWTRAKGFDTFCPLGPRIVQELNPHALTITSRVNGDTRQRGSTADMIFSPAHVIAFISTVMTLEPGDIVLTGTPAGVGPLQPGDEVEVEVEGVGTLTNPVTSCEQP